MNKKTIILSVLTLLLIISGSALFFQKASPPALPTPKPEKIRIGAHLELSGRYAEYGQGALEGIRLAIDEINAAGGLLGAPVELIVRDNKSEEGESRNAFLQLVQEENVAAVIGPDVSSCAIAVAPLAEQLQTPTLITWASNPRATTDDSGRTRAYVFRVCYVDTLQGSAMARFAFENMKISRIALLIDSTSPYPLGLGSFFEQSFRQLSGQVVMQSFYTPTEKNWPVLLEKVLTSKPEALFISGYQHESLQLVKATRSLGFNGPILLSDAWDDSQNSGINPAYLTRLYHSTQFSPQNPEPEVRDFVARYQAFAGKAPLQTSAMAYDATQLLAAAIRRAASDDRQKIRAAIEETERFPGVSGAISFNERHNAEKDLSIIELTNGIPSFFLRISPH